MSSEEYDTNEYALIRAKIEDELSTSHRSAASAHYMQVLLDMLQQKDRIIAQKNQQILELQQENLQLKALQNGNPAIIINGNPQQVVGSINEQKLLTPANNEQPQ